MATLAERGAIGHHGQDDYAACVERTHWDRVPEAKRWLHTRRLAVQDRGPHEPRPYARVGDDNRCETCGDIIVEVVRQTDLDAGVAVFDRPFDRVDAYPRVILVETNGSDPEVTTALRGNEPEIVHIDWDEVERGDRASYITEILEQIEELGVGDARPERHVGMPEVVDQLRTTLADRFPDA